VGEHIINPYRAPRTWDKARRNFPSIERQERIYEPNPPNFERQVCDMAPKIRTRPARTRPRPAPAGFPPRGGKLAHHRPATFHPDTTPRWPSGDSWPGKPFWIANHIFVSTAASCAVVGHSAPES